MTQPHTGRGARAGFTLIELMVVIAIIAILVALTAAAVFGLFVKGGEAVDRATIAEIHAAVKEFSNKHGFYPPSRLFLANSRALYASPPAGVPKQLADASLEYLFRMFPYMNKDLAGIDWSGGVGMPASGWVLLQGDQCLVFFLGGMPASANAVQGFSMDNKTNPTARGGQRISFFQFPAGKLKSPPGRSNPFLVCYNAHDNQPYAYFSAYSGTGGRENNYHLFAGTTAPAVSDCASLGVWPYAEAVSPLRRYLNPGSCQIVSAGPDGKFAPGTNLTLTAPATWTPTIAGTIAREGQDDLSNFHDKRLGTE